MSLIWKQISINDAETIYSAISGNVAEYFYDFKTIAEARAWVEGAVNAHQNGTKKEFMLFDQEVFVGMLSPEYISNDTVSVGMWIVLAEQGKGYGTMALRELCDQLTVAGVKKVVYEADKGNAPSIRLAQALGFSEETVGDVVRFTKTLGAEV